MSDETQLPQKKVTAGNLLAAAATIVLVQAAALLISNLNLPSYAPLAASGNYSYSPAGPSAEGSLLNAVLLVAFAFALTLALVWLLRRKMVTSFKVVVFGSVALSAFILTLITADNFAVQYLPASLEYPVAYGVPAAMTVLLAYIIFVKNVNWLGTVLLAFVGAEVGSFFAETLPQWTALALPIAFAIYDIYAVFRGPLKSLVGTNPGVALVGMSIRAGEFTLGLGDVVFYTLLPSLAFFQFDGTFGLAPALLTIVAIDIGMVMTLYLLSRRRLLPGLPIPVLFGVLVIVRYLV